MHEKQVSIGRDKAIELGSTNWWELCTHREIAEFQLFTAELCCPFAVFHEALEKSLGRGVYTHEMGLNYDGLIAEFLGERAAPTLAEIIDLIPPEKRIVIAVESETDGS